ESTEPRREFRSARRGAPSRGSITFEPTPSPARSTPMEDVLADLPPLKVPVDPGRPPSSALPEEAAPPAEAAKGADVSPPPSPAAAADLPPKSAEVGGVEAAPGIKRMKV